MKIYLNCILLVLMIFILFGCSSKDASSSVERDNTNSEAKGTEVQANESLVEDNVEVLEEKIPVPIELKLVDRVSQYQDAFYGFDKVLYISSNVLDPDYYGDGCIVATYVNGTRTGIVELNTPNKVSFEFSEKDKNSVKEIYIEIINSDNQVIDSSERIKVGNFIVFDDTEVGIEDSLSTLSAAEDCEIVLIEANIDQNSWQDHNNFVQNERLFEVLSKLKALKTLSLSIKSNYFLLDQLSVLDQIESLHLYQSSNPYDGNYIKEFNDYQFPNLKEFIYSGDYPHYGLFMFNGMSNLETLRVYDKNMFDGNFYREMPYLKELLIFKPNQDLLLEGLENIRNLESLKLRASNNITELKFLKDLPLLEELEIDSKNLMEIAGIENCIGLKSVILRSLSNSVLYDISPLNGLNSITYLDIGDFNSINNYDVLLELESLQVVKINRTGYEKVVNLLNDTAIEIKKVN